MRAPLWAWKSMLRNASPQKQWGGMGIPSRRFSLSLLLSSWGISLRAWRFWPNSWRPQAAVVGRCVGRSALRARTPVGPWNGKSGDCKWWSWEPKERPPCSSTVPEWMPSLWTNLPSSTKQSWHCSSEVSGFSSVFLLISFCQFPLFKISHSEQHNKSVHHSLLRNFGW